MNIKCALGIHDWNGCKCSKCGKTREQDHDWAADCEQCAKCGKMRSGTHNWVLDCEKCGKCGKIGNGTHNWASDCEKCAKCGKCRTGEHKWIGCKCSICDQTREEGHILKNCVCERCGESKHVWDGLTCSKCKASRSEHFLKSIPILDGPTWKSLKYKQYYALDLFYNFQGGHNRCQDGYESPGESLDSAVESVDQILEDSGGKSVELMHESHNPCPCGRIRLRYYDGSGTTIFYIRKSDNQYVWHRVSSYSPYNPPGINEMHKAYNP